MYIHSYMHVYNYIQYTAFDSTNREALGKALPIFGCPANCVTAPSLFTIYLCAILCLFRERLPRGNEVDYRLDRKCCMLSRLIVKTKDRKIVVIDLQYADECAILIYTAEELHTSVDLYSKAYQSMGLSIISQENVIYQPAPGNYEDSRH